MDPNEALDKVRELVAAVVAQEAASRRMSDAEFRVWITAWNLANYFDVLDRWLSKGGFLPHDWRQSLKSSVPWPPELDPHPEIQPLGPPNPAHGVLPE